MKPAVRRTLIFLLILGVSVLSGLLLDAICNRIEYRTYPLGYEETVKACAEEFDVPAHLLFALIREESAFTSNKLSSDGSIGLFQLNGEQFVFIRDTLLGEDGIEAGMLYDPGTNIRYGTAYVAYLIGRYGTWDTAVAAWCIGTDTVDGWLGNEDLLDANRVLVKIPRKDVRKFVQKINKNIAIYDRLYGSVG